MAVFLTMVKYFLNLVTETMGELNIVVGLGVVVE